MACMASCWAMAFFYQIFTKFYRLFLVKMAGNEKTPLLGFSQKLFKIKELDGRGDKIRTCDSYVPNVVLYQAELHPDGDARRPMTQKRARHLRETFQRSRSTAKAENFIRVSR